MKINRNLYYGKRVIQNLFIASVILTAMNSGLTYLHDSRILSFNNATLIFGTVSFAIFVFAAGAMKSAFEFHRARFRMRGYNV